jgi:copper chaperone NosL
MRPIGLILTLGVIAALAACGETQDSADLPSAQEPTREAVGHYCGMIVVDHGGPKGQIFLDGKQDPIWFSSVRDTLTFTMLPEEPKRIVAIYVNDMAKATNWGQPEPGTWVDARAAFFVAGSDLRGGMGALETVPFSTREAAENFRSAHGGSIYAFGEIPERFVLGPDDLQDSQLSDGTEGEDLGHGSHGAPSGN